MKTITKFTIANTLLLTLFGCTSQTLNSVDDSNISSSMQDYSFSENLRSSSSDQYDNSSAFDASSSSPLNLSSSLVDLNTSSSSGIINISSSISAIYSSSMQSSSSISETVVSGVEDLISSQEFESMFPNRNPVYTYSGFIDAVNQLKDLELKIEHPEGAMYAQKVSRLENGNWVTSRQHSDFAADWNLSKKIITYTVRFSEFINKGTTAEKKQELIAFLANISHETTGGWATAPDGPYAYGLYFIEEVGFAGTNMIGYTSSSDPDFQAVVGQSYHGRGPIQLSYPFNYGFFSVDVFGDKRLLQNPSLVSTNGKVAFMSAIWFWMTPQPPKPSAHEVMAKTWIPTQDDISKGRTASLFGMTVNIINGGLECGNGSTKPTTQDRINYYLHFAKIMNEAPESKLDCASMTPY